ncbi:hypothetical protein AB6A40_006397 [Gnathostoma spinigerum]|uniref:IFT80/172/WDR35 TPR domain-containing protein n=1 Tax=Gnathostoma spinigerum TaxID=75299 RepID=A0ABD6EI95_9BILA
MHAPTKRSGSAHSCSSCLPRQRNDRAYALELALKYGIHLDTVIGYRQKYLREIGKTETDAEFLRHRAEVEIDWEHIQETIKAERNRRENVA